MNPIEEMDHPTRITIGQTEVYLIPVGAYEEMVEKWAEDRAERQHLRQELFSVGIHILGNRARYLSPEVVSDVICREVPAKKDLGEE